MPKWFQTKSWKKERERYLTPVPPAAEQIRLTENADENLKNIRAALQDTADFMVREIAVCGIKVKLMMFEGQFNLQTLSEILLEPLLQLSLPQPSAEKLENWILNETVLGMDQSQVETLGELFPFLMSGFAGIMIDGAEKTIVCGVQGFSFRSVSEPSAEENVRGSREGFTEPIRINMTMVRRRIKSSSLKMELMKAGVKSRTDLCLLYQTDMVDPQLLEEIRRRIRSIPTDLILESGYIQPFLDSDILSIFSNVGTTERPDTLCAKISEGRVGILVDGTPFALILPYFFNENFQSIDDYTHRPYYAFFERMLKYLAFFFTVLLPGLYVAVGSFHPELLPEALLLTVTAAEQDVPFPLVGEALLIHFIYELMREAGLRLPRPIGHAIGIIGALVIGDAAVSAGLISSPMVMVVALTALSSFVVPGLFQEVTVLRFAFILIGGMLGVFGIALGLAVMGLNLCSVNAYGIPAMAPQSPFQLFAMRDVLFRAGWKRLGRKKLQIYDFPGAEADREGRGRQ